MKGGHGDNYYYQLINNVRKFKGICPPPACSGSMTAHIDGVFDEWQGVKPLFRDHRDVMAPRDHRGYGSTQYKNDSGRNDIVFAKVARDDEALYFYVETAKKISLPTDKWMMLLLDMDRDKSTGWEGYDYVINRLALIRDKAVFEKCIDGWTWREIGSLDFQINDKRLELRIPKHLLTHVKIVDGFEFKWSDNMQEEGNVMDFYVNGDVAPSGRFNYYYPGY